MGSSGKRIAKPSARASAPAARSRACPAVRASKSTAARATPRRQPVPFLRRAVLEELEPRLLMSADLNPLAHDALLATPAAGGAEFRALTDDGRPSEVTTGAVAPIQRTNEIVFVDPRVPDRAQLLAKLTAQAGEGRHFEIITLDANRPGIAQVTEALKGKVQVDAIHFITHGADGAVQLGGTWLDARALAVNSEAVANWGDSLKADADLLFYGCDLTATASGRALVDWIAELTRADVAGSDDATGSARQGGNWELEYRTGEVEAPVVISLPTQDEWDHLLATFTVKNTNDSGTESLRQAILDANANLGADIIEFDISSGPPGPKTIDLTSGLPTITGQILIDGWSHPDYAGTNPVIVIDGGNLVGNGLTLTANASGSTIRGLVIRDFNGNGIWVQSGSNNNVIVGNYVGRLDPDGTQGAASDANAGDGIVIDGNGNVVGGTDPAGRDRNVISGNNSDGIQIGSSATNNRILGNYIGTTGTGTAALGNNVAGINLLGGSNTIGGTSSAERNVISGNDTGVLISGTAAITNIVQGNFIGTDRNGTANLGNLGDGILVTGGARNNLIGGLGSAGNVISGNNSDGIEITGTGTTDNVVQGNFIGTNAAGSGALANSLTGIRVTGTADGNTIGGSAAGVRNVISGNTQDGIFLDGVIDTLIQGNYIGLSATGGALTGNGNRGAGVWLLNANGNTIGGTGSNERNVISGNGVVGGWQNMLVQNSDGNFIEGNYIGTNALGAAAIPGFGPGIELNSGSANNLVAGNLISGNATHGVVIWQATGNLIQSNLIGTNAAGMLAVPNARYGIWITDADANTVGGTFGATGNVISASGWDGIGIDDTASNNVVQGNYIGTTATGSAPLPNTLAGVWISNASNNTIGGTAASQRNVISGNTRSGVEVDVGGAGNAILGNSIYSNNLLGINLLGGTQNGFGVTANDGTDGDSGPNALQNFPTLSAAVTNGSQIQIKGSLTSTTNTNFRIEFFASATQDGSSHGEGQRFLGSIDVNTGPGTVSFTTPIFTAPVLPGEFVTATATRAGPGFTQFFETSEFGPNFVATAAYEIRGTVFDDVDGDADVAEPGTGFFGGATVRLFRDDGASVGFIDAGDTLVTNTTTNAAGQYVFTGVFDGTYYVVVDSKTLNPSTAVWAEQTYGVAGAATGGTFTATAGALYSGRTPNLSDNASTLALTDAEHVTKVTVNGGTIANINSGFSLNVVTNVRGDANDDDTTRLGVQQQGTLRQFIENANAKPSTAVNPDAMRFVPVVGANAGGGTWWQINVSGAPLPTILDPFTIIDGTAFAPAVNGPVVDINTAAVVGTTVGVDAWMLPGVARPELEITDAGGIAVGLNVGASNTTIRDLAIFGFGAGGNHTGDISVQNVVGTLIEGNVIGAHANLSDPGAAARGTHQAITVDGGDNGTIRGNLIGYTGLAGVDLFNAANGWLVEYNEIRGVGWVDPRWDGVNLLGVNGAVIQRNLITNNIGPGIDVANGSSNVTIDNNTISNNAMLGGTERYGIDFQDAFGTNVVRRNIISGNAGAGVLLSLASSANITENSIFSNVGIGIDLNAGAVGGVGDGVTLNDPGDVDPGPNALQNFPVITGAATNGATIVINGTLNSTPLTTHRVEFFASAPADPEGERYLGSAMVSTDAAGNGSFLVTLPQAVLLGEAITATATDAANNTSEFSFNAVAAAPNSPPMNSVPAAQPVPVSEDTPFAFAGANQIFVSDPDGNLSSVTLSVANGTLTASAAGTATVLGSGTAGVTIFGSQVDINGSLASLVYQALPNVNGPDTLTVTSSDGGGLFDNDPVAITVNPVNDAPVLNPAGNPVLNAINEDAGAPLGPVGTPIFALVDFATPPGQVDNVTDVDAGATLGIALTAANTTNGSWFYSTNNGGTWNPLGLVSGTSARLLAADANTRLYFQPNPNFNGVIASAITFRAWDGTGGTNGGIADTSISGGATAFSSSIDVASLTVTAVNDAPVANNDAYNVNEDWALSVPAGAGVLVNDIDIDGPTALSAQLVTGPANGALMFNPNGSFTYTPFGNSHGTDSFTYRAFDGSALSATPATVTITVNSVNDAPSGTDRTVATVEDTDYIFTVTDFGYSDANDTPADAFLFVRITTLPTAGTLTLSGGPVIAGDLVSTADIGFGNLRFTPAPDANGAPYASFTFQVQDGGGTANGGENLDATPNTITIDIAPLNDTPTTSGIADVSVTEDDPDTLINLFAAFADVEDLDPALTYSVVSNTNPGLFSSTAIAAGTLTLDYAPNQTGVATLTVRATDTGGAFVETSFTVTVTPANDTPTTSGIADVSVTEDDPDTLINLFAAFADVEDLDPALTYSVVSNTNPGLFSSTAIAAGTLTLDYAPNQTGVATLTVRATDTGGAFVETSFTVTVTPANDTPTTSGIADVSVTEDDPDTLINLFAAFADVEDLDPALTYSVVSNTNPGLFSSTAIAAGTLTLDYAPNQTGVATLTVRATDTGGAFVETSFTVTVTPANDTPTTSGIADVSVTEDDPDTLINLFAAFADVEDLDPALTYSVVSNTNPGLFSSTAIAAGTLTLDYAPNQTGVATLTVRATDTGGAFVETSFTVTVTPANDTPTTSGIADVSVTEDDPDTLINLFAAFADVEDLDPALTYSVVSNTNPGLFSSTAIAAGTLTLDYAPNQTGVATLTVRATDTGGAFVETSFTVTVTPANDTPTTSGIADVSVTEDDPDTLINLFAAFADVEDLDPALTYSVVSNTNPGLFSSTAIAAGTLTLDYAPNQTGVATLTVRATDTGGAFVETSFTVTVTPANDTPTTSGIADVSVTEDDPDTLINLFAAFADVEDLDPALTYSVVSNTNPGLFSSTAIAAGTLTLDYAPNQTGVATLTVRATDTGGAFVETSFTVTVTPANDTPTTSGIADVSVTEDDPDTLINLFAAFADVEDLDPALTYSVVSNTNPGLFSSTAIAAGTLTLDYAPNQTGVATLTVRATDTGGAFVETSFTVTVTPANDTPTTSGIADVSVTEDDPDTLINLFAAFADVEDLDPALTYSVVSNTNPGLFSSTAIAAGTLTLDYAPNQTGVATLTVRATDTGGAFVETSFTVTVTPANDTPTTSGIADVSVTEDDPDTLINLFAAFADVEDLDPALTYSVVSNTNPGLFSSTAIAAGTLTLDYAPNQTGVATLTVRATDTGGAFVETSFTVTVTPANDTPTTSGIADVSVTEDDPDTLINLFAAFADVEDLDPALTYSVVSNTNPGLFSSTAIAAGTLTLDYAPNQTGVATLTVRATDTGGAFVETSFTVTVTPANDAPTARQRYLRDDRRPRTGGRRPGVLGERWRCRG